MLEMQSDLVRQAALKHASADARKTGVQLNQSSITEQAMLLKNRSTVKKRRLRVPWLTIITIATCIPFLSGNDISAKNLLGLNDGRVPQLVDSLDQVDLNQADPIKVSVGIGDRQFHKEIAASDIQKTAITYLD